MNGVDGADRCPRCGASAYRPESYWAGRTAARRCGGCNLILGRCTCAPIPVEFDPRPLVVLDVDGTITNGRIASRARPRPGIGLLFLVLRALDFEVVAWSAGGMAHARSSCAHVGLPVHRAMAKPPYPITEAAAIAALGRRPVLQVDDDPAERVADWPFLHLRSYLAVDDLDELAS